MYRWALGGGSRRLAGICYRVSSQPPVVNWLNIKKGIFNLRCPKYLQGKSGIVRNMVCSFAGPTTASFFNSVRLAAATNHAVSLNQEESSIEVVWQAQEEQPWLRRRLLPVSVVLSWPCSRSPQREANSYHLL